MSRTLQSSPTSSPTLLPPINPLFNPCRQFLPSHGRSTLWTNGSKKQQLQDIALQIYQSSIENSVIIKAKWIPREQNRTADTISKMKDSDDRSIDLESFQYIQHNFGSFTIDRFADDQNKKTAKFNSKYYCLGTSQVDAFATNWAGEFNWLSPPVKLIGRTIKHMMSSRARGVLFVPDWRSSYYWPLLTSKENS